MTSPQVEPNDVIVSGSGGSPAAVVLVEERATLGERENILLFASTFSGPSSLYKLLAIRSLSQQIILRRNLSYVPKRNHTFKMMKSSAEEKKKKKGKGRRLTSVDDLLALKEEQAIRNRHSWNPGRTVRIKLEPLFLGDSDSDPDADADSDRHLQSNNHQHSEATCHVSLFASAFNASSLPQREPQLLQREQVKLPLAATSPPRGGDDEGGHQPSNLPSLEFTPGSLKQDGAPQSYHLYFAVVVPSPAKDPPSTAYFAELGLLDRSGNVLPDGKYDLTLTRIQTPEFFETLLDEQPPALKVQPTLAFYLSSQESPASSHSKNSIFSNVSSKPFSLPTPRAERETDAPQPTPKTICYNFHYLSEQIIQKEIRMDFVCPWCFVDYFELVPLMVHLKNFHPRFKFQCADSSQQEKIQIGVSINKLHSDMDYFVKRRGDEQYVVKDYSFIRQGSPILSGKKRSGKAGAALKVAKAVEHTLYHSQSCTPIRPDEPAWDSGDEIDMTWLKKRTESLIDDFSDVNVGEKDLMKLWNLHVTGYKVIPDRAIAGCCVEFATKYAREILRLNVRNNFCLHLLHLFNLNLISAQTVRRSLEVIEQAKRATESPSAPSALSALSALSAPSAPSASSAPMAVDSPLDSPSPSQPDPAA